MLRMTEPLKCTLAPHVAQVVACSHPVSHSCRSFVCRRIPQCICVASCLCRCWHCAARGSKTRSMHTERGGCCCMVHTQRVCWRGMQELPPTPQHANALCWVWYLCSCCAFSTGPCAGAATPTGVCYLQGHERRWKIVGEAVLRGSRQGTPCEAWPCGCAGCMLVPMWWVAASIPARHLVVVAAARGGCRVVTA